MKYGDVFVSRHTLSGKRIMYIGPIEIVAHNPAGRFAVLSGHDEEDEGFGHIEVLWLDSLHRYYNPIHPVSWPPSTP